jgi:glycerol-3-phosphate dehydrogenase
MVGPDAQDIDDREDNTTTAGGLEYVLQGARRAVPGLDLRNVVTSFAGLRARVESTIADVGSTTAGTTRVQGDFIIGPSKVDPRFIHVAGIESPGLSCAPAIGEFVRELLAAQGLERILKKNFKSAREKVIRFRELEGNELDELLKKNPSYGRLVCRCEKVTEGEVADCIRRPAGALDLDGVKRRTRAGMGRCQGGFCTPRLVELLSRELGIPYDEVTKKGRGSWLLSGRSK